MIGPPSAQNIYFGRIGSIPVMATVRDGVFIGESTLYGQDAFVEGSHEIAIFPEFTMGVICDTMDTFQGDEHV